MQMKWEIDVAKLSKALQTVERDLRTSFTARTLTSANLQAGSLHVHIPLELQPEQKGLEYLHSKDCAWSCYLEKKQETLRNKQGNIEE